MTDQRTKKELREALGREVDRNEELSRRALELEDRLNDLVAGLELWNRIKSDDWDDLDEMLWRWVTFEPVRETEPEGPAQRDALRMDLAILIAIGEELRTMSGEGGEGYRLNLRLAADRLRSAQRRIERAQEQDE